MNMIPITFLTGFYVTQVVARYWDQFMSLPWPDKIAMKLVSFIPGKVIFDMIAGFLRKKPFNNHLFFVICTDYQISKNSK